MAARHAFFLLFTLFIQTVTAYAMIRPSAASVAPYIKSQQPASRVRCLPIQALAKKKKTKRKPKASSSSSAPSAAPPPMMPPPAPSPSFSAAVTDEPVLDERLDSVLKRAGIADSDLSGAPMQPRKSADPLSNIPKAGQELLERFFGGGALIFGTAFIISGLAVAVEAFAKVLGKPLPTALEELVVQFLYPSLTPSILILFFFSISLGILKQLQLSSESTGVLYTEDD